MSFLRSLNLSVAILITFELTVLLVHSENSLKVCTKEGQVYQVSTSKCNRGAWTSGAVDVDCVCAKGLWILSENYCDRDFHILASRENQCFKINKNVRRFLSLTSNKGLESGQLYHFNGNLESINEFKGNFSVPSPSDDSYLVRYNDTIYPMYLRHEEGVSTKFWQKCFQPSKKIETVQVIKSGSVSFISSLDDCDKLRETKFGYGNGAKSSWELELGSSWHSKFGIEKFSESCMQSCGPLKETNNIPRERSFSENGKVSKEMDNNIEDSQEDTQSEEQYDSNLDQEMRNKDADVMSERLLDNGRDTIRMVHYLKKWIVHNIPGPKVSYKEYKYLQLARIIFLKSCPDIDGQTLTNFIRLFRFLIYEAFKKTPDKYPGTTDMRVHTRIVENLRKCFTKVEPYKLKYDESACPGKDGQQPIVNIFDGKGNKYSSTINGTVEDDLEFKTGKDSDTVLETAWKIMLHAHYQCAEEFKDHPEDLSTMYIKLQEFLISPKIIFRWENPGEYLNKVYGFLHPGFKLEKFSKIIDSCVNAAKESSFFKEWLRRPKDEQDFTKDSVMGRSMVLFGAKGKNIPKLFDGQGYCVNKFEDPLTWTNFDSRINAKCN